MARTPAPFLTARWSHLGLFTFAVPDDLLAPHLPDGCELDRYDGSAVASLVAFDFRDTCVFGVRWPFFTTFPELNLRFYVRRNGERGVCFVREYVPRRVVCWAARWLYNEPYRYARMRSKVNADAAGVTVRHDVRAGGRWHHVRWESEAEALVPAAHTADHFFKEHQWGFVRGRDGVTRAYEVRHPVWAVYAVRSYELNVDWERLYGRPWAALSGQSPIHVAHAVGSAIEVWPAQPDTSQREPAAETADAAG